MRTARTPKNAHEAQLVPIESVKPYPGNARTHDLDVIRESLRVNTQYRPIVVRTRTRHVLAGNGTLEAAKAEGWSEVWATFIDCDARAAKRINLVDNRANDLAGWDEQLLAAQLGDLPGVEGTGWSERELVSFVARVNGPGEDTEPSEPPKVPRTKLGDLWVLGEHRLLCGDATVAESVELLMDGQVATLMVTDPPYGVSVDHRWREGVGLNRKGKARADIMGDQRDDWTEAWRLTNAPIAYVWHGGLHAAVVWASLLEAGFEIRQQIIWVKPTAPISRCAYHWQHEPCWYAVRKGKTATWKAGRDQTTVWEAASPLHIYGQPDGDKVRTRHPTQKPLALFDRPIENHTELGEILYDPFVGSGTQIIAAENLSRRCYAMEIDPGYCDVIVDRWERHTGKKATRART